MITAKGLVVVGNAQACRLAVVIAVAKKKGRFTTTDR